MVDTLKLVTGIRAVIVVALLSFLDLAYLDSILFSVGKQKQENSIRAQLLFADYLGITIYHVPVHILDVSSGSVACWVIAQYSFLIK